MFSKRKNYYIGTIWIDSEDFESNDKWLSKVFGDINEQEALRSEISNSLCLKQISQREVKTRFDRVIDIAVVSGSPGWIGDLQLGVLSIFLFSRPKITIEAKISDPESGKEIKEYRVKSIMPWRMWINRSFSISAMYSASNKKRMYEYKLVLFQGLIDLISRIQRDNS